MKFSSSIVCAFAGFAAALTAQDCVNTALKVIPSCAQSCFLNGAPSIGCAGTDFQCQCQSQARLMAAVEGCVQKSCPSSSFQAVIDGSGQVCGCAASLSPAVAAAQGSNTVVPSNTAAPPTSTVSPGPIATAAANRPAVAVMALGGTLFAALAL